MYVDKKRAKNGEYRIKESMLWKITIFGGAIGTSLGIKKHRYKTMHKNIVLGFHLLAFVQIAILLIVIKLFNK